MWLHLIGLVSDADAVQKSNQLLNSFNAEESPITRLSFHTNAFDPVIEPVRGLECNFDI